ncbi:hypothetical protein [Thermomonospora umbrina]|uniref:DUF8175 domain-containing protein n=1 Tax=Thermomonospora umbrina TaxID=111806 RepID=A0A3D9T2P6_9ACTN|nr:hypothetical protein [Thermomonospora umbrina]REF00634.1 hypothetical protein DFJ69_6190 [Thermomonospora umbrina]
MPALRAAPGPRKRRRAVWSATAVAVAALVGMALMRDGERPPEPPPASQQADGGAQDTAPVPRMFDGVRWRSFHGIDLPYSPAHGPGRRDGELVSGFARTPAGALLAALHIGVRANAQWGPGVFEPTVRQQVVGSDAGLLLLQCRNLYARQREAAGVPEGEPLGAVQAVQEAYRWNHYSANEATVDLLTAGPSAGAGAGSDAAGGGIVRAVTRLQLVWRRGDWRVVAPPGGDWSGASSQVGSAAGYTPFPGARTP